MVTPRTALITNQLLTKYLPVINNDQAYNKYANEMHKCILLLEQECYSNIIGKFSFHSENTNLALHQV